MGYTTHFSGSIRIEPPIPWGLIKDSIFAHQDGHTPRADQRDVKLEVVEEPAETDEGTLIRRHAVAIVPAWEDEARDNGTENHVQQIIDQFGQGRTFAGRIDAEGEDAGDLWRVEIRDGNAVRVEVRLVWPEDEPDGELGLVRTELAEVRASLAELGADYRKVIAERDAARAEANETSRAAAIAEGRIEALGAVKTWTNEDGKRFVFVSDLAAVLGPEGRADDEAASERSRLDEPTPGEGPGGST